MHGSDGSVSGVVESVQDGRVDDQCVWTQPDERPRGGACGPLCLSACEYFVGEIVILDRLGEGQWEDVHARFGYDILVFTQLGIAEDPDRG
jgi:hypothetical protein